MKMRRLIIPRSVSTRAAVSALMLRSPSALQRQRSPEPVHCEAVRLHVACEGRMMAGISATVVGCGDAPSAAFCMRARSADWFCGVSRGDAEAWRHADVYDPGGYAAEFR